MNETLKTLKESIHTTIKKRDDSIETLKNQIVTARAAADQAGKDMISAADSENVKEYMKAKNLKESLNDKKSMYSTKLARLESAEIVTDEERDAFFDAVRMEQNKALAKLEKVLKKSLQDIADVYNEVMPTIYDGDEILFEYHTKIKNFQVQIGTKGDGTPNYTDGVPAALRNAMSTPFSEIDVYIKKIAEDKMFSQITGADEPKPYQKWYSETHDPIPDIKYSNGKTIRVRGYF